MPQKVIWLDLTSNQTSELCTFYLYGSTEAQPIPVTQEKQAFLVQQNSYLKDVKT